jgi:hypothetical protein
VIVRGRLTRKAPEGRLQIVLKGRRLTAGRLRLELVATDAAGNTSAPARATVRVLR